MPIMIELRLALQRPAKYQANEELLKQFENSVRDAAYDEKGSRIVLEKMIDATPKEPSH
jgi:hypothetical protein